MAKVMISLPDELLEWVDTRARVDGETRSGTIRKLVERERDDRDERFTQRMRELNALAEPHGGDGVELLKAERAKRLRKLAGP